MVFVSGKKQSVKSVESGGNNFWKCAYLFLIDFIYIRL